MQYPLKFSWSTKEINSYTLLDSMVNLNYIFEFGCVCVFEAAKLLICNSSFIILFFCTMRCNKLDLKFLFMVYIKRFRVSVILVSSVIILNGSKQLSTPLTSWANFKKIEILKSKTTLTQSMII